MLYGRDLAYVHDAGFGHIARAGAATLIRRLRRPATATAWWWPSAAAAGSRRARHEGDDGRGGGARAVPRVLGGYGRDLRFRRGHVGIAARRG